MVHWFAWKHVKQNISRTVKWREQQQIISMLDFETLQKKNFRLIGELTTAAQNDVTAKKIVSGLFQNLQRTARRLDCWRPVPPLPHNLDLALLTKWPEFLQNAFGSPKRILYRQLTLWLPKFSGSALGS